MWGFMNKKIVVITGGANGIGLATAKKFAKENMVVYVLDIDDSQSKKLETLNINYIHCDISSYLEVKNAFDLIASKESKIDVLINNAAKQIESEFKNYNERDYLDIIKTNYLGTCNCVHNALPKMPTGGTILNILSIHSSKPRKNKIAYDCSKSAAEMLTKELALELSDKKITVNGLSFGAVNTDMNFIWETNPKLKYETLKKVPLEIIFEPNQIANFCYQIIKEFSTFTTGTIFIIDGGRVLV